MIGTVVAAGCAAVAVLAARRARTAPARARAVTLAASTRGGGAEPVFETAGSGSSSAQRSTLGVSAIVRGAVRRASRSRRARADRRALQRDLPGLVELLRVAVSAGLGPVAALRRVEPFAGPAVRDALDSVAAAMDTGLSFGEALEVATDAHPALARLASTLAASADLGAGVSDALGRLGAELRAETRRRAEARARTVPVRLLFPLVFVVLPAFLLLGIVPGVLAGLST